MAGRPGVLEVVGNDAGGLAALPLAAQALIRSAALVAGPRRLLGELQPWWAAQAAAGLLPPQATCPELVPTDRPEAAWPALEVALADGRPAVLLASGDPLWFGIGRLLLQRFGPERLRFHPAPSSLQLAFARLGRPWQDASWISLHGRDPEPLAAALQKRPPALAVLTDPSRGGAEEVRRILAASGLEMAYAVWLCERLGHPEERVQRLDPGDPLPADCDPLHLVLLIAEPAAPLVDPAALPLFGLDDGLFLQHDDRPGLMTKREVRIQLLADLELPERGVLWDIGAGVGSVGLEALRLRPGLAGWFLEQRGGSAPLIATNAERLGVRPAGILEGRAPEALAALPDPDRVLIGGGGRARAVVLAAVLERLLPGGVVVIPLATVEALAELRPQLELAGCRVVVSQHQAWRGAPLADGTRLAPLNPVLVLKGSRA
ncbi:precorrin-6y C5,15-methyltransferase (decarboxylating) subunit CbiE [Vulcanococcus limneticus Candia 3F8]|nr:precorrin-6y C5,15-methyltransferase (decarboxylating) subunit CbiE [Vulcanococcus limneticus MW73D5]MCP9892369.1 precorrin-6y C5,15-methyltransferase (decarboxylating) subunit CbiE [Vulcanococcus limneticus Candia 3F8]MCP9895809.1 precorrin-6y C5,15-methyltransferase (decarboxylating) subunit CbiE [Vulcanococcus limneticus Candia 3B3]